MSTTIDELVELFDRLSEGAADEPPPRFTSSDFDIPFEVENPGDWPENPDGGHYGSEAFGTQDDAERFIEDEGALDYAVWVEGDDGYFYIFYFDDTP